MSAGHGLLGHDRLVVRPVRIVPRSVLLPLLHVLSRRVGKAVGLRGNVIQVAPLDHVVIDLAAADVEDCLLVLGGQRCRVRPPQNAMHALPAVPGDDGVKIQHQHIHVPRRRLQD